GTLLLDEIADLGLELQAKLLRVMQEKTVEPVGSESHKDVDFRLIAATNANLKSRVADGLFREDLYYRLNVIPLAVPSLNERAEDIPVLVAEFLKKYGKGEQIEVSSDLMEALVRHLWPGNIRELDNLVERMVVLRSGNILTGADLPKDFNQTAEPSAERIESAVPGEMTFKEAERKLIVDALTRFDWNKSKSARFLDIPRHVLVYRMKKHEIFSDQPV
ncbi:MAG: sigma-54-dependent Fis family transcriptional regulator, partial [candidate division Zixibacteria bacterium]|nr:sigma-54-dependent Fis family transcriptional regulator [candidate division Zixibacteria bacterium]